MCTLIGCYLPKTLRASVTALPLQGDAKDNYEMVAGSLTVEQMDPVAFPNWEILRKDENLGRLEINPFCGLKHGYDTSKGTGDQVFYSLKPVFFYDCGSSMWQALS